jgi:hypothetical protein
LPPSSRRTGGGILPPLERAALTLVLIHSVAIPRAEGRLAGDDWQSLHPTTPTRLRKLSQVHGQRRLSDALQWLHAAGLVRAVRGTDPEMAGASYVPGPALRRLTPAARQRLQENLILAVGASAGRGRGSVRSRPSSGGRRRRQTNQPATPAARHIPLLIAVIEERDQVEWT